MKAMKSARIVLFADGEVGQQIFGAAIDHDPNLICGIVSLPGNENLLRMAHDRSVAHIAYEANDLSSTAAAIRALRGNIFLLAWWPLILKRDFLALGQDVTLNLHPSLLPYARGKDPNFWTIVEESPFGVSIHHVTPDIDAGDVAFQREIPCTWEDTGETLYRKAERTMVDLFRDSCSRIAKLDIPKQPQDLASGTFHRRNELDPRTLIDLEQRYTARELLNLLRGRTFEPHPACQFNDGGETYEVRVSIRRKP
jgi:methionyl-tRNA formyltransferase